MWGLLACAGAFMPCHHHKQSHRQQSAVIPVFARIPASDAAPTLELPEGVVTTDLRNVADTYSKDDYQRQVFALMNSKGVDGKRIVQYVMKDSQKIPIYNHLMEIQTRITDIPNSIKWESISQKSTEPDDKQFHTFQCDMYVHVTEVTGDSMNLTAFLGGLTAGDPSNIQLLNHKDKTLTDREILDKISLVPNDLFWMEITETPKELREKLLYLERSFEHFEDQPPKVAVVCLNGEKGFYDEAMEQIKAIYEEPDDKLNLNLSKIVNSDIPVFVIFTPNRNVYQTLQELKNTTDYLMIQNEDLKNTTNYLLMNSEITNQRLTQLDDDLKAQSDDLKAQSDDLKAQSDDLKAQLNALSDEFKAQVQVQSDDFKGQLTAATTPLKASLEELLARIPKRE